MILKTKLLTPPLRKRPVQRPHLFEKLNQGLVEPQHRLTVVNAPAGYGKTTLVALWLARLD